jgi:hypothetical protein
MIELAETPTKGDDQILILQGCTNAAPMVLGLLSAKLYDFIRGTLREQYKRVTLQKMMMTFLI